MRRKEKRRTCYLCREKGHLASSCTNGTSSNPITIDPTGEKARAVKARYVGVCRGCGA